MKARFAGQIGLAEAVCAVSNLATAQVRKDTPSLIDVKGVGRPKELIGKEEDVQQWPKKTEAFFAGVTKGSEILLDWSAEQVTEITQELIRLEFLPAATNMHTTLTALTRYKANDRVVANSWKNPLKAWRRLQKRYDPTTGGTKRTIISLGRCSLLEFQTGIERWESYVSRDEKNGRTH